MEEDYVFNLEKVIIEIIFIYFFYDDVFYRKLEDYYNVVRPVVLAQLAVSSSTLVFLSFVITLVSELDVCPYENNE